MAFTGIDDHENLTDAFAEALVLLAVVAQLAANLALPPASIASVEDWPLHNDLVCEAVRAFAA